MLMLIIAIWTKHKKTWRNSKMRSLGFNKRMSSMKSAMPWVGKLRIILGHIDVLEAIVTDREFDLSEKITRLK